MEVVVQESLERRMRAAKYLLKTSSIEGLIDIDNLREEAWADKEFDLSEHETLFGVFKAILGVDSEIMLDDILFSLSTIDREAALQALKMAFSYEEVQQHEII
jgi:hypothetical protein